MKSESAKGRINRGAPSGFMASLMFHAAIFFLAGLFIVFKVLPKPPTAFEPPPAIERPRMKLKKPKVKVRKSSQPKPSSRIVAKVKTREMPEIQLPDLTGVGEGLMGGSGFGEVMDMPDIPTVSLMGSSQTIGSDLVGTYYDLKRKKTGAINSIDRDVYYEIINKFLKKGWDTSVLSRYYTLPNNLYMTALVVPVVPSSYAPVAFGDEDASEGRYWLVHYKGRIAHSEDITFRFWAAADFVLIVRLNGEIVCASTFDNRNLWFYSFEHIVGEMWTPTASEHRQFVFGRNALAAVGDWVTLKADEPQDIEIIVSDEGGLAAAYLAVEEQGVDYELGAQGGPILPVFRTAELSHDQLDAIYEFLPEDETICLTNGPIFNDFGKKKHTAHKTVSSPEEVRNPAGDEPAGMRTWTLVDGRTFEAELFSATDLGKGFGLRTADGSEIRIARDQLSSKDQDYILLQQMKLDIDFSEHLDQKLFSSKLAEHYADVRDPEDRATFSFRIKQLNSVPYDGELYAEFFAIGKQIAREDRYILLARGKVPFRLTKENDRKYEYRMPASAYVPLRDIYLGDWKGDNAHSRRGRTYRTYLVTVSDKNGNIIAYRTPNKWLYENLDNLKKLSAGNFMDEACVRRYPIRPPPLRSLNF